MAGGCETALLAVGAYKGSSEEAARDRAGSLFPVLSYRFVLAPASPHLTDCRLG